MTTDDRPRGEWLITPWFLRALGCKLFYRNIYAHPRIGGGWDGWEFSSSMPASPLPASADRSTQ